MLVLSVQAVLDRDRGVDEATSRIKVFGEIDDKTVKYAILSHRWQDEVDYSEMKNLMEMEEAEREKVRQRNGYKKILESCKRALRDGFGWMWVDACCIDQRSSAEVSEAINSMYRFYANSTSCYVYLHDVDSQSFPTEQNLERFSKHRGWPEWFSRGWTLQELIAPEDVQFFNKEWTLIGDKRNLADTLEKITRIPKDILISGLDCVRSAAQIMSWASDRETTREEDQAYSLLGLFGVHMPMVYGEGRSAFRRLQLEIIRLSNDYSLFAWDPEGRIRRSGSILADDPSYFRDCGGIWNMDPKWFVQRMRDHPPAVTSRITPSNAIQSVLLTVRGRALIAELSTCSIASGGLQISLPIAPYPGSLSLFKATLGCVSSLVGPLMTIDLVSDSAHYYRYFGPTGPTTTFPRVKRLFLSYHQRELYRRLKLDDRTVSYYGFKRGDAFPCAILEDSIKLSLSNDLTIVTYANDKAGVRFAVGFGYYLGSAWTYIICDERRSQTGMLRESYAKEAYDAMWSRQADLARIMSDGATTDINSDSASFIRHAHLPRSIWDARITWGVWYRGNCTVNIDIVPCTGCCYGPLALKTSTANWNSIEAPGPMREAGPSSPRYALHIDGSKVQLLRFPGIEIIQLGDYGYWDSTFKRDGNIFQDLAADPAYDPVKRKISAGNGGTMAEDRETVWTSSDNSSELVLSQPAGLSLPNNEQLRFLLKNLSSHLTNKCLVTSIVRCGVGAGAPTQLCYLSTPQVWCPNVFDKKRRARLKEIRVQFYTLLNWHPSPTSTGDNRSSNSKVSRNRAIKYFSDMFGIKHFESYAGRITFFKQLSSPDSEILQDSSTKDLVKILRRRMDKANTNQQMQGVKREIGAISGTLGIRLLQEITAVYFEFLEKLRTLESDLDRRCVKYDISKPITEFISLPTRTVVCEHHVRIRNTMRKIEELEERLDATNNINEQLALEEDITGRILWTCHAGLRDTVGHIPAKVLHGILENDKMYDLMGRVKFLEGISGVFNDALTELPTDDQAHLRRIMADAEADTSKYQLLLEQRVPGATSMCEWQPEFDIP